MPHDALSPTRSFAPNLFEDIPLLGFELAARAADEGSAFLLSRPGSSRCLRAVGMNRLLQDARCTARDGKMWIHDANTAQMRLAHDTSQCLDVFGPHAGDALGVYWCHGAPCLSFFRCGKISNAEPRARRLEPICTGVVEAPHCTGAEVDGGGELDNVEQRLGRPALERRNNLVPHGRA